MPDQRYILRVDDVCRMPEDPPEFGSDGSLNYFSEWRASLGLEGEPAYYGVVPRWIMPQGITWMRRNLRGLEELAVHGWDHARGAVVQCSQMADAVMLLSRCGRPVRSYIPPFNIYDQGTIKEWGTVPYGAFFGGMPADQDGDSGHHYFGPAPTFVEHCTHLSAFNPLYGRSGDLLREIERRDRAHAAEKYPIVVTLHVPWEKPGESLRSFGDALRGRLVSVDAAIDYAFLRLNA